MTGNDFAKTVSKAGVLLADTAADAFEEVRQRHDDDLYNEGYEKGQAFQREQDIRAAVSAFLELKVKDHDIFRLLSAYFNLDSISEASGYLIASKKSRQIIALREYCKSQGMGNREFREYADSHGLDTLLLDDERLLDMQPERLKAIIDKM